MNCDAVVFDLFGTLVPPFSLPDHSALVREMAALLNVPAESFGESWTSAYPERGIGAASPSDQIHAICRQLGHEDVPHSVVAQAMELRVAFFRRTLVPRPGAVEVLRRLRAGR